jgi:thymidylate synthase
LPANIAGLQIFNEALVSEINTRGNLSLKTGKLIFHSKNCHIYQRQFKLVKELLEPKNSLKIIPRMAKTMKGTSKEASPENERSSR